MFLWKYVFIWEPGAFSGYDIAEAEELMKEFGICEYRDHEILYFEILDFMLEMVF